MTAFCVPESWGWPERCAAMYRLAADGVPWARRQFGEASGAGAPAEFVLRFAQAARYVPDPAWCPTDYYQSPDVTWAQGGDCDDLVILGLAIAKARGVEARVEHIAVPSATQDHVCLGLWHDGRWCFADPSMRGARLGEHPVDAAKRLGRVMPAGPPRATGVAPLAAAASAATATSLALPVAEVGFPLVELGIVGLVFAGVWALAEGRKVGALPPQSEPVSNPFTARQATDASRRTGFSRLPRGVTGRMLAHAMTHEAAEHADVTGGDPRIAARIALAHLREDPMYYAKLAAMDVNPFAGYANFSECEREARGRGISDTGAYCATIMRRVEQARR